MINYWVDRFLLYFIFQEIFVFVWPIKGVYQNKNILQGVNQKNNFTGRKLEMTYITGGKDLLTLNYFT